jgi:hypothetical protein
MSLRVIYIESSFSGRKALRTWLEERHTVKFVEDLIDLDELLYDMEGYRKYDVLIVDLALDLSSGISMDDLKNTIPEFEDIVFTQVSGSITLLGFDYYKHVLRKRPQTEKMVAEKRVILFSGHAKIIRSSNYYTDEDFPTTPLIDRADAEAMDKLGTLFNEFRK